LRRVVKHLESAPFVARLSRLSPGDAAVVTEAVRRIRRLATNRLLSLSDLQTRGRLSPLRAPSPSTAAALARFVDVSEVRELYFAALAAAGFEVVEVPPHAAALREITLRSTPPGLRLLYGIDEPRGPGADRPRRVAGPELLRRLGSAVQRPCGRDSSKGVPWRRRP
jgi:hypothetical protein